MSELKTDASSLGRDGKTGVLGHRARVRWRSPSMLGGALLASLLATGGLHAAEPSAADPREEAARLNSLGIDL